MGNAWKGPNRVPNAPLREAFQASPMTASEVCVAMGWMRNKGKYDHHADTTSLMRTLGLHSTRNRRRKGGGHTVSFYSTMTVANAKAMCAALGLDFDELYPNMARQSVQMKCTVCGAGMLRRVPEHMCGFCIEEAEQFGEVAA